MPSAPKKFEIYIITGTNRNDEVLHMSFFRQIGLAVHHREALNTASAQSVGERGVESDLPVNTPASEKRPTVVASIVCNDPEALEEVLEVLTVDDDVAAQWRACPFPTSRRTAVRESPIEEPIKPHPRVYRRVCPIPPRRLPVPVPKRPDVENEEENNPQKLTERAGTTSASGTCPLASRNEEATHSPETVSIPTLRPGVPPRRAAGITTMRTTFVSANVKTGVSP